MVAQTPAKNAVAAAIAALIGVAAATQRRCLRNAAPIQWSVARRRPAEAAPYRQAIYVTPPALAPALPVLPLLLRRPAPSSARKSAFIAFVTKCPKRLVFSRAEPSEC